MNTPADWGLPSHITSWRPNQLEAVQWCAEVPGYGLLEAPTGSGKTGIAKALARDNMEIALARTKLLQETVYREHGFQILMGKGNYPCIHEDNRGNTAEDCLFEQPGECEHEGFCPYRRAVRMVMGTRAASVNYSFFLVTKAMWKKRERMFLDECHLLPDIVLEFVGVSINKDDILKWRLPRQPMDLLVDGALDVSGLNRPERGLRWLEEIQPVMEDRVEDLTGREDKAGKDLLRQAQRLLSKIERAITQIGANPVVWFMCGSPDGFYAKPLTAKYHFIELFGLDIPTILMSGTIGDFETLANELGIPEFQSYRVPSQFGPSRAPIYDLGAPKLSYKSSSEDLNVQADLIAAALKSVPSDWSGVIHTTKKQSAFDLADRLARKGLQERIWVTPQVGTNKQIIAWEEQKRRAKANKMPGQLAVAWSWTEGVDLREERICISAKCLTPDMVIASPERRSGTLSINQVQPGMKVYTLDSRLQLVTTKVKDAVLINWYDGLVFDWHRRGIKVTVSADHQMMVMIDGRWVKADMLDVPEITQVATWDRQSSGVTVREIRCSRQVKPRTYHGALWCVETEAGTILAGAMGQPHFLWMGNCPFGDLGAPYEKARFNFSHRFYLQRTAWDLQQQLGRTRRGEEDDYDTEDDMRGLVAIADGAYKKVQKYLSESFRESIVEAQ
jgi:Rad3-related DNA helicase